MTVLYPRNWKLTFYGAPAGKSAGSNQVLDVSNLRFVFSITAADVETPNTLLLRIYNLSESPGKPTVSQIQNEFSRVNLQAGYGNDPGTFGVIFDGLIRQTRRGRENQVNTYLDILAGDNDDLYNYSVLNTTLPANNNGTDAQFTQIATAMGGNVKYNPTLAGGVLPRGKVMWGMARESMRDLARTNAWSWSIINGQLYVHKLTEYPADTAVKLTSKTGMIGMPIQTDQGVIVKSLIDPKITIGTLVQINEKDVQLFQRSLNRSGSSLFLPLVANVTRDGFYRVLAIDYAGDTRGNDWTMTMTCLSVDPVTKSIPAGAGLGPDAVLPGGSSSAYQLVP